MIHERTVTIPANGKLVLYIGTQAPRTFDVKRGTQVLVGPDWGWLFEATVQEGPIPDLISADHIDSLLFLIERMDDPNDTSLSQRDRETIDYARDHAERLRTNG